MGQEQIRSYLERIRRRYKKSTRQQTAKILDWFCSVCEYNRKYTIRMYRKNQKNKRGHPGRKPKYDAINLLKPLKDIWFASDKICSKRLKSILLEWLPHYEFEQGLPII